MFVSTSSRSTPPWLVGDGGGVGVVDELGGGLQEHRHDVVHRAHDVLLDRLFLYY